MFSYVTPFILKGKRSDREGNIYLKAVFMK